MNKRQAKKKRKKLEKAIKRCEYFIVNYIMKPDFPIKMPGINCPW